MSQKKVKMHVTGMGGQGIGLTTRVLAVAAEIAGLNAMTMETHGLAQRGGIVDSDLVINYDPSESPQCADGEADVIIALEALEGLRAMQKLKKNGIAIINTTKYQPLAVRVSKGKTSYPSIEEITNELRKVTNKILMVSAQEDARKLGMSQVMNMILIGALVSNTEILPITKEQIESAIKTILPPKYHKVNLKAFQKGLSYKF